MNIYAKENDKVVVTEESQNNGYEHESEKVKRMCKVGEVYTVARTAVSSWHTTVFLKELPNIAFNSVCFEDYDPQKARYQMELIKYDLITQTGNDVISTSRIMQTPEGDFYRVSEVDSVVAELEKDLTETRKENDRLFLEVDRLTDVVLNTKTWVRYLMRKLETIKYLESEVSDG